MAETKTFVANAPAWIDLSSQDKAAARDFYSNLFGWKIEVGGPDTFEYGMAKIGDKFVAGIGGTQDNAPSAWMLYIGTHDADAVAKKVEAAGGKVVAPPFDVLESGRMAVFQDPTGAFFAVWQPKDMKGFDMKNAPGSYGWAELNARGRPSRFIRRCLAGKRRRPRWARASRITRNSCTKARAFSARGK